MVCSARSPGATGVALLAEGVDRNDNDQIIELAALRVALLAEGVDRNVRRVNREAQLDLSPSSRRAWIEI